MSRRFVFGGGVKKTDIATLYAKDLSDRTQIWLAQGEERLLLKEYSLAASLNSSILTHAAGNGYVWHWQPLTVSDSRSGLFNQGNFTHNRSISSATTEITTTITEQAGGSQNDVYTFSGGRIPPGIYNPKTGTDASISGSNTITLSYGSGETALVAMIELALCDSRYVNDFALGYVNNIFYQRSFSSIGGDPSPVNIYSTYGTSGLVEDLRQVILPMGMDAALRRFTAQSCGGLLITNGAVTGHISDQSTQSTTSLGNMPFDFRPVGMLNTSLNQTKVWVPYLMGGGFFTDQFIVDKASLLITESSAQFEHMNMPGIDAGPRRFLLDRTLQPGFNQIPAVLLNRTASFYGDRGSINSASFTPSAEAGFEEVSVLVFRTENLASPIYTKNLLVPRSKVTAAEASRILAVAAYAT